MGIEKNIVKLHCGSEYGTAILIDDTRAITARHCLKDAYLNGAVIELSIVKNGYLENVNASLSKMSDRGDALILLDLEDRSDSVSEVKFLDCGLDTFQNVRMFGYGRNYSVEGGWIDLKSIGRKEAISDSVCDLRFHFVDANDSSFSGFSGSPVCINQESFVMGIISQEYEESENHKAVYLEGISVRSQKKLFEKHGISIVLFDILKRNLDGKPGTVQNVQSDIIGMSDTITELNDAVLQEIISIYHKGGHEEARNKLKKQIEWQQDNDTINNVTKSQFLLQQAIWQLEDSHNMKSANKSYKRAIQYNAQLDVRIFLALRSIYSGRDDAKSYIGQIDSLDMLNAYIQICVCQNDGQDAVKTFDMYKDIFGCNERTWYLMSAACLLMRDFQNALEFINKAIEENADLSDYFLIRALILYWKAVPDEVLNESDGIYPGLYSYGWYFLDNERKMKVMEAVEDFKTAYLKADRVGNGKKKELVLSCWINSLSIDNSLFSKCNEPLELLKTVNPYHIVILMVDILCGKAVRDDGGYEKRLRALIKKEKQNIGYISVLIEYFIHLLEEDKAKSLLFEYEKVFRQCQNTGYWYEHIIRLETDLNKKKKYLEMMNKDASLSKKQKRRINCMFTCDSKKDAMQQLESLYADTGEVLDLMNIIWYSRKIRCWKKVIEYGKILSSVHDNPKGCIYQLEACIRINKYEDAYKCIQEIERLNISELSWQIQMDKMTVLEKMGELNQAIEAGESIFVRQPEERLAHLLANLYMKKGNVIDAIQVLRAAEKKAPLSKTGYQRLSGLFHFIDKQKSVEYAEKYVEVSKRSPDALSWAATNAANIGMSNIMGTYWQELMQKHPHASCMKSATIEEVIKMINTNIENIHECEEKYNHSKIPLHILIDGLKNILISRVIYENWMNPDGFSMISFGWHCETGETGIDKIILDYTSCILLQELDMLSVLAENVSEIFIPSNMMLIIRKEQDELSSGQEDILEDRKKVLDYCIHTLKLKCSELIRPDHVGKLRASEQKDAIYANTAKVNEALWVDTHRYNEDTVTADEIFAVLSSYGCEIDYDKAKIKTEIVEMLKMQECKLFVSILMLEDWFDKGILDDINEKFEIVLFSNEQEQIENECARRDKNRKIYARLECLKNFLDDIDKRGKLKWCTDADQEHSEHIYSELLSSAMSTMVQKNIPYCVEDRWMQCYGFGQHNYIIYNTLDVVKIMCRQGWIHNRIYLKTYKRFIDNKAGFFVIDSQFIFQALNLSSLENGRLVESKQLISIKSYIDHSFFMMEKYGDSCPEGMKLMEKDFYNYLYAVSIPDIIGMVWSSDMNLEKKKSSSDWVILNCSRIGEIFSVDAIDFPKYNLDVFMIDKLIFQGIYLNTDLLPEYNSWFSALFAQYLEKNINLLNEVIENLLQCLRNILQNKEDKNKENLYVYERIISFLINYVPEYLKDKILEDHRLLSVYKKHFAQVIRLDEDHYIPEDLFQNWINETLAADEKNIIDKEYDGKKYTFSWKYTMTLWPVIKIDWNGREDGTVSSYQLYRFPGLRLYHEEIAVRIREARKAFEYIGCDTNMDIIEQLSTQKYRQAADTLNKQVRLSNSYIKEQILFLINNEIIFDADALNYFLPADVVYFKQMYDYGTHQIDSESKIQSAIPVKIHEPCNCGRSFNPVRRLHYMSWFMYQNDFDKNDFKYMFEFLEDDSCIKYGQIYITLLHIIYIAMNESDDYAEQPEQNRIIWTYIWADKLYEVMIAQIQSNNLGLEECMYALNECEKNITQRLDYLEEAEDIDIINPLDMNIIRICFLGNLELCLEFIHQGRHNEYINVIMECIMKNLNVSLNSADVIIEFWVSHENRRNEWDTFFARNYRKELNKLLTISGTKEKDLLKDNNIMELKKIILNDVMSDADRWTVVMECLNKPNKETEELLQAIFQKFYLDSDNITLADDYKLAGMILSGLAEGSAEQFRKLMIKKMKNRFLSNMENWKEIRENLMYIVGNSLELYVEFWLEATDEMKCMADPEFIMWLTKLQLALPLELSNKVFSAKVHMINYRFELHI